MNFRPDHPACFVNPRPIRMQFTGKGFEYFRIWIVNLFLSLLTFGIYSAWAKVRRERYFCSHTILADSPFEYHGRPMAILKGRILAVIVIIGLNVLTQINEMYILFALPLILVGLPWALRTTLRFKAANTSWRGVHFYFHGGIWETIKVLYGWSLLNALTLGLTMPASLRRWHKYIFNNLSFGGQRFNAAPGLGGYYTPFIIPAILLFGSIVLFGLVLANLYIGADRAMDIEDMTGFMGILSAVLVVFYILLPLLFFAYVNVRIRNHLFNNTLLGHHGLASDQTPGGIFWVLLKHGLLVPLTAGLYLPAFKVAMTRYKTTHTQFYPAGSLDDFVAVQLDEQRAFGEELTDFLDMDLGL